MRVRIVLALCLLCCVFSTRAEVPTYHFSVLNQRSPTLIAQYWNPILAYVSQKAKVDLKLKIARTAVETTALTVRGEAQFAYTNHLFTPERAHLGWRVIARRDGEGIHGQLVVEENSPLRHIEDLNGKIVAFPSVEAFVGFKVIMDALLRKNIQVTPIFAGNQEGAIGLMKAHKAAAAGVNLNVMKAFAKRESYSYRALWTSERFHDLAIMVNPRFVPQESIQTVQKAFIGMMHDPEGAAILLRGAELLKLERVEGFVAASDRDYENYLTFYRNTLLKSKP